MYFSREGYGLICLVAFSVFSFMAISDWNIYWLIPTVCSLAVFSKI